ncbi:SMI1/KNR4 family protein [Lysinibacillus telephonicus]|uniref:SMI1/KNR4 family protein n=1 Tax=Lysinibacillus telephonicus TaxID=1714840 RepID=A0A3S0HDQ8_9BACI|nr:SMI1/KNR4 family protein [Lysinibacillus telephonicus]RTQ89081.1 SMI1/KNR4 family protein [Lysinibacillus telephonicus]
MDYKLFNKRIETIVERIRDIGGEISELTIGPPASQEKIEKCERQLDLILPKSFKKVLLEFSSEFNFRWFFPENYKLEGEFSEIFCGTPSWSLDFLKQINDGKNLSVEGLFSNPDDPYDKVWHNKLAFYEVGDGDCIAFDLIDHCDDAPVVYLSYGDGEGHGFKLGDNFIDFIDKWSRIAFVGGEDWQWITFTENPQSGFLPESKSANQFRNLLKLDI